MALAATRLRLLWGAFDFETESAKYPQYASTQYAELGDSAASGAGIGVRRATLLLTRAAAVVADDASEMHFDFMNFTGGNPDDTWTSADYTTLEGLLTTWWATVRLNVPSDTAFSRILWNRVGPGVPKPNPAERILDITTPSSGTGTRALPPQAAMAISLRHPIRRSWGRTYLPIGHAVPANGRSDAVDVDRSVAATVALAQGAKAADFAVVVTSPILSSALLVETIVCDDTVDIIRRRRWKHTNYKKLTAV
jgi:hypothetical protein